MSKKGFTLAEVLVTIAVIGIVATITLPALNTNWQRQAMQTATAKFYNQLQEGVDRFLAEQNANNLRDTNFQLSNFFRRNMRVSGQCDTPTAEGCFAPTYRTLTNEMVNVFAGVNPTATYTLNDGAIVAVTNEGNSVIVDVNGQRPPNRIGWDLWRMTVYNDGIVDEGVTPADRRGGDQIAISEAVAYGLERCTNGSTTGCFANFIRNNFRFDY